MADGGGFLTDITERTKIKRNNGQTQFENENSSWTDVDENAFVSMNMWCFPAAMPREIEPRFNRFLAEKVPENPEKSEFLLPTVVHDMLTEKLCTVKVIPTAESWHGVTYKQDKQSVVDAIAAKINSGEYPAKLWK